MNALLNMATCAVRCAVGFAVAAVLALPAALPAQAAGTGSTQYATRAQLTEQLATLERNASSAKSADKAKALDAVARVKQRLEQGDFKAGDRFVLVLRQDSVRSDTLVVRDSLRVAVLNLPEFSVAGLLRSELEERMTAHIARFLKNFTVRTTQLVRLSVTGAVRNPGFFYAVPDRPLNDLLTSAGGPLAEANLNKVTVTRIGKTILDGKAAKQAVEQGRTLEELDIQGGDAVHVPLKKKVDYRTIIQFAFLIMSLTLGVLNFLRWYYGQQDQ
ncbi:polysaccharide biosynthesis/export family protein [Gemmatimonas sp.]